jgi:sulfotransferase family protein
MSRLPSFIIIGAMKSATSTLYEQLIRQPGIFLPQLKEPNFFSNDEQYALGIEWYSGLFKEAREADILGEASTHYTKLPTYPQTISRMRKCLSQPRFMYVMRHPVDRLVSQYIHQWSDGEIRCELDAALERHPELVAYSCYARQLKPFIETYGKKSVLPVFFDRLIVAPQQELERVCRFIGYAGDVQWYDDLSRRNISAERVRKFALYNLLVEHPLAVKLRHAFVPKALRTRVRELFSIGARPTLATASRDELEKRFDEDLQVLGDWLGVNLDCRNFRAVTAVNSLDWR